MERNFKVYIHTCPNNKVYIGITSLMPENRWNNGKGYSEKTIFGKAIKKYGWDNIKHEILFEGLTEDEAKNKEKELIAKYKSNNRKYGYNMTAGGDGTWGYKHTEEAKEKCRQSSKGNKNMLGKHWSEESKKRLSESLKGKIKGKKRSEESKRKQSESVKGENNHMYGKHHTQESIKKISENMKGKNKEKWTEERKKKQSERMKGKAPWNKGKQCESMKKLKWYTNGNEEIRATECPAGFVAGRLKKKQ